MIHKAKENKTGIQNIPISFIFPGNSSSAEEFAGIWLSQIYLAEGFLTTNKFFNIAKKDLVGSYTADTVNKTREWCENKKEEFYLFLMQRHYLKTQRTSLGEILFQQF